MASGDKTKLYPDGQGGYIPADAWQIFQDIINAADTPPPTITENEYGWWIKKQYASPTVQTDYYANEIREYQGQVLVNAYFEIEER